MNLELFRRISGAKATIGDLFMNGAFECFTLEDVVREDNVKVWGATAIPAGTYKIIINMSPRLKHLAPRLLDVPMFDGILIHKGNKSADTHGCILVGRKVEGEDLITHSTEAYDALFTKMKKAYDAGEPITITIHRAQSA